MVCCLGSPAIPVAAAVDGGSVTTGLLLLVRPLPAALDPALLPVAAFVFFSGSAADLTTAVVAAAFLLPKDFWAPRPAEAEWLDEATPPRADWVDSDSDGRGPLSRKGLSAVRVESASVPVVVVVVVVAAAADADAVDANDVDVLVLTFFLVATFSFSSSSSESERSNNKSSFDLVLASNLPLVVGGCVLGATSALPFFLAADGSNDDSGSMSNSDLQLPILMVSAAFLAACR